MNDVIFLHPEAAWAGAVAALFILAVRLFRRRHFAATANAAVLHQQPFRPSTIRHVPAVLAIASVALVVIALMDPVRPLSSELFVTRGVDIAIVLDLSSSMEELMGTAAAASPRQTRLDVTKRAIAGFIRARPGDRIGLVVFSDNAYVVSPLTIDHDYLVRYVDMIDNQILRGEGMTALGEGVAVANSLLERQAPSVPRDRVIYLAEQPEQAELSEDSPVSHYSYRFPAENRKRWGFARVGQRRLQDRSSETRCPLPRAATLRIVSTRNPICPAESSRGYLISS